MKAKIIIVEDHEPIRNELKILLSKYGYEIIVRFMMVIMCAERSEKNQKYRSLLLQVGIARLMS